MAYAVYLVSVPPSQVDSLRNVPQVLLQPARIEIVSHLIAYWVKVQPLGKLLGEAVQGGELLTPMLHHPLRNPVCHRPDDVAQIHSQLAAASHEMFVAHPVVEGDWFR